MWRNWFTKIWFGRGHCIGTNWEMFGKWKRWAKENEEKKENWLQIVTTPPAKKENIYKKQKLDNLQDQIFFQI